MADIIKDGTGGGYSAKVNSRNRLQVISKSEMLQHLVSKESHGAFQCIGTASLSSGTVVALLLKNNSSTKNMIVTYNRHQIIDATGGTAIPNASNYYRISLGRIYDSGGTLVEPVNIYAGSGVLSEVTAYEDNPTLTGTAKESDRWYTKANGDMSLFNKEGSLIIPPNESIELSYVGDQTSGTIYTRLSFVMDVGE